MKNMTHRHVFLILWSEYLKVCDIMPKIPNQSCTKAFLVNLLTSKLKKHFPVWYRPSSKSVTAVGNIIPFLAVTINNPLLKTFNTTANCFHTLI